MIVWIKYLRIQLESIKVKISVRYQQIINLYKRDYFSYNKKNKGISPEYAMQCNENRREIL